MGALNDEKLPSDESLPGTVPSTGVPRSARILTSASGSESHHMCIQQMCRMVLVHRYMSTSGHESQMCRMVLGHRYRSAKVHTSTAVVQHKHLYSRIRLNPLFYKEQAQS
jgi:hypothetical protein